MPAQRGEVEFGILSHDDGVVAAQFENRLPESFGDRSRDPAADGRGTRE
jgi:hypothetical protein